MLYDPPPLDELAEPRDFDEPLGYMLAEPTLPARAGGGYTGQPVDSREPAPPCLRCDGTGVVDAVFRWNDMPVAICRPCHFCGELVERRQPSPYDLALRR